MWRQIFFVLPLTLSTFAIRVPVDVKEENATEIIHVRNNNTAEKKQDTFYISDEANVDSYLIPPDPHRPIEVQHDHIPTLATYLLPPSPEKHIDYYAPTETGEQTDWYPIQSIPIAQASPLNTPVHLLPQIEPEAIPIFVSDDNQSFEIVENPRGGKALDDSRIPVPSRQLEPPLENAPNDYTISIPSEELELPSKELSSEDVDLKFNTSLSDNQLHIPKPNRKFKHKKNVILPKPITIEPTLALHLTPPKPLLSNYKIPTKLYPKKVSKGFQPIPIPIAQFSEGSVLEVPRAKPVKPFKPVSSDENEYFTPSDEKNVYLYEKKQKLKDEKANIVAQQQQPAIAAEDTYGVNAPAEQETSETNYRHPGRNVRPAPLRQAPQAAPQRNTQLPSPSGERTEFRMHGMKGPHSYQFGFDTGKGKNRQFRYEERDNEGHVKGHYGYVDKHGKLRVVNYDADPEHGFHAEAPIEQE